MRIRAKANGNVLDLPEGEAQDLLATGIYEQIDAKDEIITKDSAASGSDDPPKGRHKRKDMRAEP